MSCPVRKSFYRPNLSGLLNLTWNRGALVRPVHPVCRSCHTLKFPNFRMWIERIIKQEFSHNFKIFLNIYFVYRKSSIGKKSLFDFLNKIKLVRCECCIHADASWCFLSVKGFKSAIRGCPNPSENFPDFSGIYSHFSLSYFYLLEGSKIFFMSSKRFIWIVRVPI
jgi:hypothetical protein